jgi:uncharacterized membrane protein
MAQKSQRPAGPAQGKIPIVEIGRKPADGSGLPAPGVSLDRHRGPLWLVSGAALALLALAVFLPGSFLDQLAWLNSGVCPQRPAHSYFFDGQQMPLEARMVGIFAGFLLTFLGLWLVGRGRALQWPSRRLNIILAACVLAMVFDGLNSTFLDLGWPVLYQPQNWLRVVTGAISGVGMAGLLLPVVNMTVWRRGYLTPTFRRSREIVYALIPALLYALGVMSGWGPLFWPLSLLAVVGVIVMLVMLNLVIFTIVLRKENTVSSFYGFLTPLTLVLLVSLGEMALFAALRLTLGGGQTFV